MAVPGNVSRGADQLESVSRMQKSENQPKRQARPVARRARPGLLSGFGRQSVKWLSISALVVSLGAPWALLQSVAWVGMLVRYSQETTFRQAVAMTFDGKHPCKLCRLVQQGSSEDVARHKKLAKHDETIQLGLPPAGFSLFHPPMPRELAAAMTFPGARIEAPPRPPPRWA